MRGLFTIIGVAGVLTLYAQKVTKDTRAVSFANTIVADDLEKHLKILASDEYEGRETCKPGQKKAADYLFNYYENLKLDPLNNTDIYFQRLPLIVQQPKGLSMEWNGQKLKYGDDYTCPSGMLDGTFSTDSIVFIGYGIEDKNYSDYKGVDVKGKVVMVLNNEPVDKKGISMISGEEDPSEWTTNPGKKIETARAHGARAVITIRKDLQSKMMRIMKRSFSERILIDEGKNNRFHFLEIHVASEALKGLIGKALNIKKIEKAIKKKGQSVHKTIGAKVVLTANGNIKHCESENVAAVIKGAKYPGEFVFITSHYDHIGVLPNGEINNGADDDGSGTVSVLEIAEAFARAVKAGYRPKRTVIFLNFAGEEKGLLGSRYWVENMPMDYGSVVADLNIDMVGRIDKKHEGNGNYIYLIGSDKLSQDLHKLSEDVNDIYTRLELDYQYNDEKDPNRYYYRSDHYNFAKHDIPVIFYFNGVHEDYHKPTDTVDKIDFEKMEKIARLVFLTAWEIANREKTIARDVKTTEDSAP